MHFLSKSLIVFLLGYFHAVSAGNFIINGKKWLDKHPAGDNGLIKAIPEELVQSKQEISAFSSEAFRQANQTVAIDVILITVNETGQQSVAWKTVTFLEWKCLGTNGIGTDFMASYDGRDYLFKENSEGVGGDAYIHIRAQHQLPKYARPFIAPCHGLAFAFKTPKGATKLDEQRVDLVTYSVTDFVHYDQAMEPWEERKYRTIYGYVQLCRGIVEMGLWHHDLRPHDALRPQFQSDDGEFFKLVDFKGMRQPDSAEAYGAPQPDPQNLNAYTLFTQWFRVSPLPDPKDLDLTSFALYLKQKILETR